MTLLIISVAFLKDQKKLALTDVETARLGAIVKILRETSYYHSSSFADVDIDLLLKLLSSWPLSMVFPGLYVEYEDLPYLFIISLGCFKQLLDLFNFALFVLMIHNGRRK